jgi:hypothetical protein
MKKISAILVAVIAILFAAGCSLSSPATGHLVISLPTVGSSSAKGASKGSLSFDEGSTVAIRIFIKIRGSFIQSDLGTDYYQKTLLSSSGSSDSGSFSIDLPAASGYQVFAAIGTLASDKFAIKYSGETTEFTVSSGVYTSQPLTVSDTSSTISQQPGTTASYTLVMDDGTLWEVIDGYLYKNGSTTPIVGTQISGTIYAMGKGYWFSGSSSYAAEPWISTSNGIYAYDGSDLKLRSTSFGSNAKSLGAFAVNIDDNGTSNATLVAYYYGSGTKVGVASSTDTSSTSINDNGTENPSWSVTDIYNDPEGWTTSTEAIDFVKKVSGDLITATAFKINTVDVAKTYGFFQCALGAYYYNQVLQKEMDTNSDGVAGWLEDNLTSNPYELKTENTTHTITSFALDGGTTLYAGTAAGLFKTTIDENGNPAYTYKASKNIPNPLTQVSTIGSVEVAALAATTFNSTSYAAIIDADGNVVITDGLTVTSYPFYSYTSAPGAGTGLSFYSPSSGVLHLIVSAADGVSTFVVVSGS